MYFFMYGHLTAIIDSKNILADDFFFRLLLGK